MDFADALERPEAVEGFEALGDLIYSNDYDLGFVWYSYLFLQESKPYTLFEADPLADLVRLAWYLRDQLTMENPAPRLACSLKARPKKWQTGTTGRLLRISDQREIKVPIKGGAGSDLLGNSV